MCAGTRARRPFRHPLSLSPWLPHPPLPPPSPQPAAAKPATQAIAKAAAVFAATVLLAAPAFAVDKAPICARTPTAKICLRDSAKN